MLGDLLEGVVMQRRAPPGRWPVEERRIQDIRESLRPDNRPCNLYRSEVTLLVGGQDLQRCHVTTNGGGKGHPVAGGDVQLLMWK